MNREAVKSNERVALQTFLTAEATALTLVLSCTGRSCMTAARIASGPRVIFRFKIPENEGLPHTQQGEDKSTFEARGV